MRHILGSIGLLRAWIASRSSIARRPTLVVPKDTTALRNPEDPEAHERNPSWPVDPDVTERKKEQARRRAPAPELLAGQSVDGRRLSMDEIRAGRAPVGAQMTEGSWGNDKTGIRLSPSEWAAGTPANAPSYPPGTEPPRRYLTDPPKGRQAAAGAPMKRTQETPRFRERPPGQHLAPPRLSPQSFSICKAGTCSRPFLCPSSSMIGFRLGAHPRASRRFHGMATLPTFGHFHLENGLEVVVIPDHPRAVVTHMIYYRNGSADDPLGKVGHCAFP